MLPGTRFEAQKNFQNHRCRKVSNLIPKVMKILRWRFRKGHDVNWEWKIGEAVGESEKQGVRKTSGGEVFQKISPQQSEWYRERSGQAATEESFVINHLYESNFTGRLIVFILFCFLTWEHMCTFEDFFMSRIQWYGGARLCTTAGWMAVYIHME